MVVSQATHRGSNPLRDTNRGSDYLYKTYAYYAVVDIYGGWPGCNPGVLGAKKVRFLPAAHGVTNPISRLGWKDEATSSAVSGINRHV